MISGLLGKKIGMTHIFGDEGRLVPVTVLEIGPCVVTQLRTNPTDGYEAVQVGYGETKALNRPARGHLKRANASDVRHLREFTASDISDYRLGQTLDVRQFFQGEIVHVTARSKGRGFQGVMKRHGFHGGPKSHGQSDRARAPGSIGAGTSPGRVLKGRKMAGHMGNRQVTVRGLQVAMVDPDRNLLMLRGAVPVSRHTVLAVRHSDLESAAKAYVEMLTSSPPIPESEPALDPAPADEVVEQPETTAESSTDTPAGTVEGETAPAAEVAEEPPKVEAPPAPGQDVAPQEVAEVSQEEPADLVAERDESVDAQDEAEPKEEKG